MNNCDQEYIENDIPLIKDTDTQNQNNNFWLIVILIVAGFGLAIFILVGAFIYHYRSVPKADKSKVVFSASSNDLRMFEYSFICNYLTFSRKFGGR